MVESDKTKRYVAEKIALAALLVISLLVARLVIELRSVIRWTSPVELSRSGLSVLMPQGNGWQCDEKWVYGDGGFTINSIFAVRAGQVRSYARCHYLLVSQQSTPQEQFSEDAVAINGKVVETDRIETADKLVVDWARISGEDGLEMASGVCELAGGRQLQIDVLQTEDGRGLARDIFELIVKSIQFSDNGFLQAGMQVVSEVRDAGAGSFADDGQPIFLILYDSKGKAIGFTMDSTEVQADVEPALRAASYFYRRGAAANEEAGFFRGDVTFKQFDWKVVESGPRTGRKGIEMSAEAGVLTVRKSGAGAKEREYVLGGAAVPDIILEPVLQKVLSGDRREIVVDVIRPEGTIVPVYIEKIIPDGNSIKLEILDGQGYRQQIYYDAAKQPAKIVVGQPGTYTFNRATAEQIAETFPERADLVLKQEQLIGREEL